MKVICIDSSNKPAKISLDEWVKEGAVYTVILALNMGLQPGKIGFKLKEIQLTEKSFPYECYDASRFVTVDYNQQEVLEENLELTIN